MRARLVTDPIAYPWSSARAHIEERDDEMVSVSQITSAREYGKRAFKLLLLPSPRHVPMLRALSGRSAIEKIEKEGESVFGNRYT